MNKDKSLVDKIDSLLPQTQCGLCGYGACRPYAKALANQKEQIDRCPPGGIKTLFDLAALLECDPTPFMEEMEKKTKLPSVAIINENECIGCTKCIQACPVDAIIGASKQMHTVLTEQCTGCELCLEPCPVDCITMIEIPISSPQQQKQKSDQSRTRYESRQQRLNEAKLQTRSKYQKAKLSSDNREELIKARRKEIEAAIARTNAKKREKSNECEEDQRNF